MTRFTGACSKTGNQRGCVSRQYMGLGMGALKGSTRMLGGKRQQGPPLKAGPEPFSGGNMCLWKGFLAVLCEWALPLAAHTSENQTNPDCCFSLTPSLSRRIWTLADAAAAGTVGHSQFPATPAMFLCLLIHVILPSRQVCVWSPGSQWMPPLFV